MINDLGLMIQDYVNDINLKLDYIFKLKYKMIFVLCGLKGSGKDTIGNYLVKYHKFVNFSFAGTVKDIYQKEIQLNRDYLEKQKTNGGHVNQDLN